MTNDKATIATLTAQLAEARAMVGAVIERAAQVADTESGYRNAQRDELAKRMVSQGDQWQHERYRVGAQQCSILAGKIRALDPDATAAPTSIKREAEDAGIKREAEDAGIKIGLRAGASVSERHRSKVQVNEPLWHEGQDWAAERISEAILALTPDEARKLGAEE